MIVVVGTPAWTAGPPASPAGPACLVALEIARQGAAVELVGRVGEDPTGEALMIALTRAGVGHAAVLRDPSRPTATETPPPDPADGRALVDDAASVPILRTPGPPLDEADVALGLGYLGEFQVLVVTDDVSASVLSACVDGAAFTGAQLVVLLTPDTAISHGLPADATVLLVPATADQDGAPAFFVLVGRYAAGLDRGSEASAAFITAAGDRAVRHA